MPLVVIGWAWTTRTRMMASPLDGPFEDNIDGTRATLVLGHLGDGHPITQGGK